MVVGLKNGPLKSHATYYTVWYTVKLFTFFWEFPNVAEKTGSPALAILFSADPCKFHQSEAGADYTFILSKKTLRFRS